MGSDGLFGNTHASNVRPSDEHHRGVRHYEGDESVLHDDGVDLSGEPLQYERFRDELRVGVRRSNPCRLQNVVPRCGYQGYGGEEYGGPRHVLDVHACLNG